MKVEGKGCAPCCRAEVGFLWPSENEFFLPRVRCSISVISSQESVLVKEEDSEITSCIIKTKIHLNHSHNFCPDSGPLWDGESVWLNCFDIGPPANNHGLFNQHQLFLFSVGSPTMGCFFLLVEAARCPLQPLPKYLKSIIAVLLK